MFIYFDDRVKEARESMNSTQTEICFGLVIVAVCPLMNWVQYQLFSVPHKMLDIYPTTKEKGDYSQLNGLIIFDSHSSTIDGKRVPFGWKLVMAKIIGYTLYVLPFCTFTYLAQHSSDDNANKSFIEPLQIDANSLSLIFVTFWFFLIVLSLLEHIEHPGKWHKPAKRIITILFCSSAMMVPGLCSNIANMKLICLMNSNQDVCANVRAAITCESYDNIGFQYTTEGNEVVKNYYLNATGYFYFNY